MVLINERDILILKVLAAGAATPSQVRKYAFQKEDGGYIAMSAVIRRLKCFEKHGLVKQCQLPISVDNSRKVYMLDEAGALHLVNNHDYDETDIRMFNTAPHLVLHELLVSECWRTLKRADENKALYNIVNMHLLDEYYLKSTQKIKKGDFVPDIRMKVFFKKVVGIFHVEIDAEGVKMKKMLKKIFNLREITLVICLNKKRIVKLQESLLSMGHEARGKAIFFALFSDFNNQDKGPFYRFSIWENCRKEKLMLPVS